MRVVYYAYELCRICIKEESCGGEIMRTTIDLPVDLVEEAKRLSGAPTKTATIVIALKTLIDRKKVENLRKLRGNVEVEHDLTALRHRSGER
jgi:Arc/MetJ family transcription regulator